MDDAKSIEHFGQVVDSNGIPVPGARIVVVAGSVPMPEIALLSDDIGRFLVSLPSGVFTLRAHGPPGAGEVEVEVEYGRSTSEIVIMIG